MHIRISHDSGRIAFICVVALLTACTEPKETTGLGAAAGGAIGAGLGAIIGSQSGNAGSGLVIGAVAGSATGALVGNAMQAQQEATRSQDEAIERQERMIRAQRSEIDELRRMNQDDRSQHAALDSNRANYPTGYPSGTSEQSPTSGSDPKGRFADIRSSLSSGGKLSERDINAPAPAARDFDSTLKNSAPTNTDPAAPVGRIKPATESSDVPSCSSASKEQKLAANASDTSDKLFHLRRALRLCPDNAQLHHELGKVYASLKRTADAEYEYKQALQVDPKFQAARTSLEALKGGNERF